jgi:hypothetical protein
VIRYHKFSLIDAPIAPITPTACTLFAPRGACLVGDSGPLVLCDTDHHRLLLWKSVPSVDDAPADLVIGQADFVSEGHSQNTIGPATLNVPTGVASDPPGRPRRRRCVESSRAALAQPAERLEPAGRCRARPIRKRRILRRLPYLRRRTSKCSDIAAPYLH